MKEQTGAHIEMNKNSPHDAPTKQFFIKGTPEQIKAAKDEIAKIVGDGGSKFFILYSFLIVILYRCFELFSLPGPQFRTSI